MPSAAQSSREPPRLGRRGRALRRADERPRRGLHRPLDDAADADAVEDSRRERALARCGRRSDRAARRHDREAGARPRDRRRRRLRRGRAPRGRRDRDPPARVARRFAGDRPPRAAAAPARDRVRARPRSRCSDSPPPGCSRTASGGSRPPPSASRRAISASRSSTAGDDEIGQLRVGVRPDARAARAARQRAQGVRRERVARAAHAAVLARRLPRAPADEELDDETRREFLATMQGQVERLTKLSTNLLDLSRVDAGQLTWSRSRWSSADGADRRGRARARCRGVRTRARG